MNIMIVTMLFTNSVIVLATSTTPATTSTTAESTAFPSPLGRTWLRKNAVVCLVITHGGSQN